MQIVNMEWDESIRHPLHFHHIMQKCLMRETVFEALIDY